MFKYAVANENIYDFISDHEYVIQSMLYEAGQLLSLEEYPNEDEHRLALCSVVGSAIVAGVVDIEDCVDTEFSNSEKELLYQVVHALFVRDILWRLEEKGCAVENEDSTYTITDLGVDALQAAKINLEE